MKITLPMPPSLNHTYQFTKIGRYYKVPQAIQWELEAGMMLLSSKPRKPLLGVLFCQIDMFLARDRDIDSSLKLVLDTLAKLGFYENDKQIEMLVVKKYKDEKEPRLEIQLKLLA